MPDFRGRSGVLRVEVGAKQKQWPVVLAAEVGRIRENLNAVHAELLLRVKNAAQQNFRSDIRRPGEKGQGSGGRRQTGRFTFGTTAGGAFVGQLFQDGDAYGFGYPDIARADQATQRVWRALEYGLTGTRNSPRTLGSPWMVNPAFPQGVHKLPRAFHFTGPEGDPSSVLVLGASARSRQHFQVRRRQVAFRQSVSRYGAGIEGKHFIELAWDEVAGNRQLMSQGYTKAVRKAIKSFS